MSFGDTNYFVLDIRAMRCMKYLEGILSFIASGFHNGPNNADVDVDIGVGGIDATNDLILQNAIAELFVDSNSDSMSFHLPSLRAYLSGCSNCIRTVIDCLLMTTELAQISIDSSHNLKDISGK